MFQLGIIASGFFLCMLLSKKAKAFKTGGKRGSIQHDYILLFELTDIPAVNEHTPDAIVLHELVTCICDSTYRH